MHLSFVTSSLHLSGGVQVVVEYANRLAGRGHSVSIVTPCSAIDPEIRAMLSPDVAVRESALTLKPRAGLIYQACLALSLAQAIPSSDLVIATHTPTIVPTIVATLTRPQCRLWLYMDYAEMFRGRLAESWLLQHGPAWFDRILTLSEAGRQDAIMSGAKKALVVGLSLNAVELFVPRGASREKRDDFVVMYLGDARPRKGLAEFLAAAEQVRQNIPGLRLLIVSKEPLSVAASLACEIVVKPSREALPDLYRRSDVFVFPSWGEGFGLPPLEAMACGVPVVVTDSRGVREYARSGENCLMVPPRNVGLLAEALYRILSDLDLARTLAEAGVATASRFSWEACVDRFEEILKERRTKDEGQGSEASS
jgi:glycosyltransferase involved in cell wall biosynthesis